MTPELMRRLIITASMVLPFALAACQTPTMLSIPGEARSESADDVLRRLRETEGLRALSADAQLEKAAREQAGLMAARQKMQHTTGRGDDFVSRVRRNGIEGAAAENIARGSFDTERLFLAWMNSRGHRRNMLDGRFTRFGLASAQAKTGERYWALVLAR
jgi:uncharacterized protein YkwD